MSYWCRALVVDGVVSRSVRIEYSNGRISRIEYSVLAQPGDVELGTVLPGMANAHSHAFHRVLRGRTHGGSGNSSGDRNSDGDFWQWRESMYRVAAALTPDNYYELARAVFAEMLVSGYTAVGEFHYVHHRPGGAPYETAHAMELALAEAAREVGIRLVLLDTCYLAGGIGKPLEPQQLRFGDGAAERWLERWHSLREAMDAIPLITVGAAIHSVRAVPPDAISTILAGLPEDAPLHVHLSEQPAENAAAQAAWAATPTQLLAVLGALSPRLSAVHATHLTPGDIELLGRARVNVVMCPTTEADLGDGIGPAAALAGAGARIAIGSDQNAVIDPFLELRGLEAGERLSSGLRGRFSPAELLMAGSNYAALGLGTALQPGALCDLIEVATDTVRTSGSRVDQLPMTATATDVRRVIVGGKVVAGSGSLAGTSSPPADLMNDALREFS